MALIQGPNYKWVFAFALLPVVTLFFMFIISENNPDYSYNQPQPLIVTLISFIPAIIYLTFTINFALGEKIRSRLNFKHAIDRARINERLESILTSGIKEPLIERLLEDHERTILKNKLDETGDNNFNLDLHSPIFRLEGKIIVQEPEGKLSDITQRWSVRGLVIDNNNYLEFENKFFKEGEEVLVEFSPFSKWVWDIYKVYNDKKVILMSLYNEVWQLLEDKKTNIVIRAPYGSHNIEQINIGDIIAFSNFKISINGLGPNILTKVRFTHHFQNIEELINSEGIENLDSEARDSQALVNFIYSIDDYRNKIAQGGVYAIGVEVLKITKNSRLDS